MSEPQYTTAIAHLLLAASSAWTGRALGVSHQNKQWVFGTLAVLFTKGCLGVFQYGIPEIGEKLSGASDIVSVLSSSFALPLYATEVYYHSCLPPELAILHVASGAIPFSAYVLESGRRGDVTKTIVAVNAASLVFLGVVCENYFAIASAATYAILYFSVELGGETIGRISSKDLFTVGLCLFNYFVFRSLS